MARQATREISPWNRRTLTIPPNSLLGWFRLAIWEFWMGTLVCGFVSFGAFMIVTAPERIITAEDLSRCYAPPPIEQPCDRVVYRTGALNAAFTALFGGLLMVGATAGVGIHISRAGMPLACHLPSISIQSIAASCSIAICATVRFITSGYFSITAPVPARRPDPDTGS